MEQFVRLIFAEQINEAITADKETYAKRLSTVRSSLGQARKELSQLRNAIVRGISPEQLKEPLEHLTDRVVTLEQEKARLENARFEPPSNG